MLTVGDDRKLKCELFHTEHFLLHTFVKGKPKDKLR